MHVIAFVFSFRYMSFILGYPWWFVLFCIIIGAVYTYILYGRKAYVFSENENKAWKYGLAIMRFLSTSMIAFLLLSLLIKTKKTEEEKPVIVVLQDNSASLQASFGNLPKEKYTAQLTALEQSLQSHFEVLHYNFGATLKEKNNLDFSEKQTDISAAIDEVYMRHGSQNIGAIVLASDGIFNQGISPLYNKYIKNVPFYTIALGDTTIKKDALIKSVRFPELVYLGDKFSMQIQIEANKLKGTQTQLMVTDANGKSILQKSITIDDDRFFYQTDVICNADKPGILPFKIHLQKINGETILENNSDVAFVDVIDGRQKIVMLYDAPHPDIKAFKNAIEQNKNYQFEQYDCKQFSGNINDVGLLILHGLPSNSAIAALSKIQAFVAAQVPILWVLSSNVNLQQWNSLQSVLKIVGSSQNGNDVFPIYLPSFSKFTLSETSLKTIQDLPPLLAPFGKYQSASTTEILFNQQIGSIPTQNPCILFQEINGKKNGIIVGEGIWRWRMHEFAQNKNTTATDELIQKIVQYLTVKGDKRRFKVHTSKSLFNSNEAIQIDAELYNESFELVNDVDASCVVKNDEGKSFSFTFDKTMNAYSLNAGLLPAGNYTVHAKANYKGKANTAICNFSVRDVVVELLNTQANHQLLQIMATQSGGQFYFPKNMASISDDIEKNNHIKTILFDTFSTEPLMDKKWWFFLIAFLLICEWFIRKYNGNI